ncbi:RNA-directed DNA polymerase, eukaryota, reverse transcriptase zinc-binding domain protein [Tanacetum coccineum]|uniref:RNA-directed DNA polymerase, eukaryota, reverse transcriptase zinc-binding domain protein n=1 Tax=Tanacetum coccineum TaxID=301880 RepID=A0ABQ5E3M6_9ASTR
MRSLRHLKEFWCLVNSNSRVGDSGSGVGQGLHEEIPALTTFLNIQTPYMCSHPEAQRLLYKASSRLGIPLRVVDLYVEHNGYDALDIRDQAKIMGYDEGNESSNAYYSSDDEDLGFVDFHIEADDNLVIMTLTTNDHFLNKLCSNNGLFRGFIDESMNANVERVVEDIKSIDPEFNVKQGMTYLRHNPTQDWNKMEPVLGMRFEHPEQLKLCLANRMSNKKRSSKRIIRVSIRFGDSIIGVHKKNIVSQSSVNRTDDEYCEGGNDELWQGRKLAIGMDAGDNVGNKNVVNNIIDKNYVDTVNGKVDNTEKSESIFHLNNCDATAKEKYDINIVGEKNSNSMNRNKLVDIVNATRLDNTLLVIPTKTDEKGNEVVRYARVLIELNAKKESKDKIKIVYKGSDINGNLTKTVKVEYAWKPPICTHCQVFGHDDISCRMKPKERMEHKSRTESGVQDDTFQMVQNKKIRNGGINHANRWNGFNGINGYQKNIVKQVKTAKNRQNNGKVEFKRKNEIGQGKLNGKEHSKDGGNSEGSNRITAYESPKENTINASKDVNVQASMGIKESNRFTILESLVNEEDLIPPIKDRKKVDEELENDEDVVSDISSIGEGVLRNEVEWVIHGDFNVTLEVKEHFNGSSVHTSDMTKLKNCVEKLEIEDVLSSGFQYTWTKSLKNPNCKTLKKLDRVMINENFLDKFPTTHSVFLPDLISDHSPAILTIPKEV